MKGDLARVFEDLFAEAYLARKVRSRAEFARSLILSQLQALGHEVEDGTSSWGGSRSSSGDESESPGQLLGLEAA